MQNKKYVTEGKKHEEKLMAVRLECGECALNEVSAYASHPEATHEEEKMEKAKNCNRKKCCRRKSGVRRGSAWFCSSRGCGNREDTWKSWV